MSRLSIIIPAFNEEKTIQVILKKIFQVELINKIEKEVIIIDDFSSDLTITEIKKFKKKHPELSIQI